MANHSPAESNAGGRSNAVCATTIPPINYACAINKSIGNRPINLELVDPLGRTSSKPFARSPTEKTTSVEANGSSSGGCRWGSAPTLLENNSGKR
jgi:hypothetical protein